MPPAWFPTSTGENENACHGHRQGEREFREGRDAPGPAVRGHGKYNEALVKAGILLAADGLHPSSRGVRVHFSGTHRTVTDGPFAETKELIAGYWLWEVRSMEEAVEWVRRCPNPHVGDSDIEIRPIFSEEEFAALLAAQAVAKP